MDLTSEKPAIIEFGHFRIVPHRRELLADGQPVHLGGRTFDVLMALIEGQGAVVSKGALMERVWPNRIVEESSLHVQISVLRNAFGADRKLIRTISGRGYQFTGEIRTIAASPDIQAVAGTAVPVPAPPRPPTNLPEPVSELIGREVELEAVLGLIAAHRLVTLTGAGGIGKTSLGLEVARRLLSGFADGVWAIELAPLSDPDLVPAAVATALGLDLADEVASPERVANALAAKQLLLVLDNCEHLVGAAACMAEALLRANPTARVMATSREAQRAASRCERRVSAFTGCRRSPCRRRAARTRRIRCDTAPSGCSSRERARQRRSSCRTGAAPRRSRQFAGISTASRWRSSWRQRGRMRSGSKRSRPASMIVSIC